MEPAAAVSESAHRLGLDLQLSTDALVVERAGQSVRLDALDLALSDAPTSAHRDLAWALLGIRLGLDKLRPDPPVDKKSSPLGFRRTRVRRYQEAPSVYGEHLPFLVPDLTRQCFETVSAASALSRPWLLDGFSVLITHERGMKIDVLTQDEQARSSDPEDKRWENARTALFYEAYKLRPQQVETLPEGTLRIYHSTEGMMASRVLLFPEFDYDTAQDHGFFAVPDRDHFIVARPNPGAPLDPLREALQKETQTRSRRTVFAMTDAVFQLSPNDVAVKCPPSFRCGSSFGDVAARVLAVQTGPGE